MEFRSHPHGVRSHNHRTSATKRRRLLSAVAEALESRLFLTTVTVNSISDTPNYPGNVIVSDLNSGTPITLRDGIDAANNTGGNVTINFDPSLTAHGAATITLGGTELSLDDATGKLTIAGPAPISSQSAETTPAVSLKSSAQPR